MVASEYNAAVLVCASLLAFALKIEFKDIAATINLNLPGCCLDLDDVQYILGFLSQILPEWVMLLGAVDTDSEGFRVTFDFLEDGLLAPKSMPEEDITMLGLQKTMGRIIFHARKYAINTGSIQKRSFESTQEGDEVGDDTDEYFQWWDHPGNLGF